jgi:hypothetical protein
MDLILICLDSENEMETKLMRLDPIMMMGTLEFLVLLGSHLEACSFNVKNNWGEMRQ